MDDQLLLVDGGDYTHPNMTKDDRLNWFVLEAMGRMGYDAMTLGELELYRGAEYVERILAESQVPVALANVFFADTGERVGAETVVVDKSGVKIGILGLMGQDFGEGVAKFEGLGFRIDDPFEVAAKVVPELSSQVDVVVVLSHAPSADTFQLPKQVNGIDLLVFGHYPGTVAATQVDGAVTIRSGQRGQHIAETRVVINPENEVVTYEGKATALLIDTFCEDPTLAEELTSLKDDVEADQRKSQLEEEIRSQSSKLVLGQDHFMGDAKCSRCHADIYSHWQETPHARAFQTLVDDQAAENSECLKCHVTGFQLAGGFQGVGADADMRNVQCEACHDMGTRHNMIDAKPVGEVACLGCHDQENSPAFDFESYWAEIAHPKPSD